MTASIYPAIASGSWLEIDLDAIRFNAKRLYERAGVPLVAMVKADAYGLGATEVARALGTGFGSDAHVQPPCLMWGVGVATIAEAVQLRANGCLTRILCCTPLLRSDFEEAIRQRVRASLHVAQDIAAWASLGGGPWHLSVDSGMARAGVRWDEVAALSDVLRAHPPEGVFTHFHSAEVEDGSRQRQDARFQQARASLADVLPADTLIHTDNSAAIASGGHSAADLVRPGIALYGAQNHPSLQLRQVVHLRARIVDVRDVRGGESVGYGATWKAPSTRRIATVPVGYGDGYRRNFSNRGEAIVRGERCNVVGRISMDMTTIDVTGVGCGVGDVVTLLGTADDLTLTTDAVAASAELSPYELLVGLKLRLPRYYIGRVS